MAGEGTLPCPWASACQGEGEALPLCGRVALEEQKWGDKGCSSAVVMFLKLFSFCCVLDRTLVVANYLEIHQPTLNLLFLPLFLSALFLCFYVIV